MSHMPATSKPFWALCLLLVLAFLFGGGSRDDITVLMVLRPAAILLLGYGLWGLSWPQVQRFGFLFSIAAALLILVALHLVPLPPAVWSLFPGREVVAKIDHVAGLGEVWRPLSLAPSATWNAFYALLVPMAVLVLGARLDEQEHLKLLPVVMVLGCFSALIGLLQILGEPEGPLYFYDHTNNGSAVGLFANRNHQALLLAGLFPMLATWGVARRRGQGRSHFHLVVAILTGLVLIPLLLITGSRTGLILGLVALLLVPAIIWGRNADRLTGGRRGVLLHGSINRKLLPVLVMGAGGLVLLAIWLGRAEAIERLMNSSAEENLRVEIIPALHTVFEAYFPVGSGIGSFQSVYRLHEPAALLMPIYVNHAHNDWLEVTLTAGLAGMIVLLVACIALVRRCWQLFIRCRRGGADVRLARLGLVFILLAGLASITDYPLRVPSLACLFVLSAIWAASARQGLSDLQKNIDV